LVECMALKITPTRAVPYHWNRRPLQYGVAATASLINVGSLNSALAGQRTEQDRLAEYEVLKSAAAQAPDQQAMADICPKFDLLRGETLLNKECNKTLVGPELCYGWAGLNGTAYRRALENDGAVRDCQGKFFDTDKNGKRIDIVALHKAVKDF